MLRPKKQESTAKKRFKMVPETKNEEPTSLNPSNEKKKIRAISGNHRINLRLKDSIFSDLQKFKPVGKSLNWQLEKLVDDFVSKKRETEFIQDSRLNGIIIARLKDQLVAINKIVKTEMDGGVEDLMNIILTLAETSLPPLKFLDFQEKLKNKGINLEQI